MLQFLNHPRRTTCLSTSYTCNEKAIAQRKLTVRLPPPIPPEVERLLPAASLAWQCIRLRSRSAAAAAERRTRHADIKCGSRPAGKRKPTKPTNFDQKNCALRHIPSLLRPYLPYVYIKSYHQDLSSRSYIKDIRKLKSIARASGSDR